MGSGRQASPLRTAVCAVLSLTACETASMLSTWRVHGAVLSALFWLGARHDTESTILSRQFGHQWLDVNSLRGTGAGCPLSVTWRKKIKGRWEESQAARPWRARMLWDAGAPATLLVFVWEWLHGSAYVKGSWSSLLNLVPPCYLEASDMRHWMSQSLHFTHNLIGRGDS